MNIDFILQAHGLGGSGSNDKTPPPPISNFQATNLNGDINLSWENPTDTDFVGLRIQRKVDSYPTSITDGTTVFNGSGASFLDTNVVDDTAYYYRVFTYDYDNNFNDEISQQLTIVPIGVDDIWTNIGNNKLIAGDMQAGFFGEVAASELWTGDALALAVGITAGTSQHSDTVWLKFAHEGKILFRPKKAIRHTISWDNISSEGCVFGTKTVTKNGVTFKVRLMKGSNVDPAITANDATNTMIGSEWNKLMLPIHKQAATSMWAYTAYVENNVPNWGVGYTDADLLTHNTHGNSSRIWCQETSTSNSANRVVRGGNGVSYAVTHASSFASTSLGWAPILEVIV